MKSNHSLKRLAGRIIRIILIMVGSIIVLIIAILLLIRTPVVQNYARKKVVSYLQSKLHTRVEIGNLYIGFPEKIIIRNIYLEDQSADTLLSGGSIAVGISMFKLLKHEVQLNSIDLDQVTVKIKRLLPDSNFNFDYIIKSFASSDNKTSKPADTASSFHIALDKIHLQHIAVTYKDDATGNDAVVYIGELETHIRVFDPVHFIYSVPDISLSDVSGRLRQYKPILVLRKLRDTINTHNANGQPVSVRLGDMALRHIAAQYRNDINGETANAVLGIFNAGIDSIDLQKMRFRLRKVELKNTTASLRFEKKILAGEKQKTGTDNSGAAPAWRFDLGKLDLDNDSLQYDDENKTPVSSGMDYNHLRIGQLAMHATELSAGTEGYSGHISQIGFLTNKGFTLKKFAVGFLYNDREAQLNNLIVQTGLSTIKNQSSISYASADAMAKSPGNIHADISFNRSTIAVADLLTFVPSLAARWNENRHAVFHLDGKLNGLLKDLHIPGLAVSGLNNTDIRISGTVRGLPDAKNASYHILLSKFVSSRKDIETMIPAGAIPPDIRLPERLSAQGTFNGSLDQFMVRLNAVTSNGYCTVDGRMDIKHKAYDMQVKTESLDIGYILNQGDNFGKITMQAHAKGSGFDYKTMNSTAELRLDEAVIKGYEYKNWQVDATLQNGSATLRSAIHDDNIRFDLQAHARFTARFPAVELKLRLDTLNAYALHLLKDSVHLKLKMDADFASTDPDALQGNVKIYGLVFADSAHRLTTDTISLVANRSDSGEDIHLQAEMADIDWRGKYKLTETGQALQQIMDRYYKLPAFKNKKISPQEWKLQVSLRPSPMLLQYLPALKGTDSVSAKAQFNSETHKLDLTLTAPKIQYNQQVIHQLRVQMDTRDSALHYRIDVADAGEPGLQLYQSSVRGYLANNQLAAVISLKDKKTKERYHLAGKLAQVAGGLKFALNTDSLLLNYDRWSIAKDNFIQYDSAGLIVNDLKLNNQEQSLAIRSASPSAAAPIDIVFDHFRIKTLTSFAEQDSLLLDGLLNGKAEVKHILTNPVFTTDLTIHELAYKKDTVGDLLIKVNNEQANAFAAHISVSGHGNDFGLDGIYYAGESRMDMKLHMAQLNLALLKTLSAGQLQDIRGNLTGDLHVTGSLPHPVLNGGLHFDNAFITPTISGETLKLSDDNIAFDQEGLNFDHFVLLDSAGDKATLDGNIYTTDFKKYRFDLSFSTVNFRLLNAPQAPNRMFYGKLNLDADVDVTGDLGSIKANANLRVNKQTDFTLILPSNDPEVQERTGVVVFVDKAHPVDTVRLRTVLDSLGRTAELKGMDISATIETDSSAQFTLIIDERNGDALAMRGRAYLSGGIDRSGKTTLTGNYELENGSYNVSLSVLKRKFIIQRGSTITWTGDPRTANVDITATYFVNAASIDLVQQQLAGRSAEEIGRFKEKLPFQVNLKMTGELLKPVISFDITLPEDQLSLWPEVDNKLQQMRTDQSEVDKQVFALLLLNRFVEDNPLQSAIGSADAGILARQSVSKILSDQLNQLAGSLIKGVDLNFDLNSEQDYATGQAQTQTQLDVGVSKSLFSDRIKVTVGSNFQLEDTYANQNTSTIAGDVDVDYRLSKDGRYMLRAYRKDQYETIVEGQVVETGLSFILTFDYNQFKELFQNRKEDKKLREAKHPHAAEVPKPSR